jgi:hypothetical protein
MPLVSYQTDRLLSGWILPPLVIRALGAHGILQGALKKMVLLFQGLVANSL